MNHLDHPITHQDELAGKLRENFPRADVRAIEEYLSALRAYEISTTPAALNRLVTSAQLLAIPTIHLES